MNKVTVIITAGGVSARFGSNKLLEKIGKYSVIETTIQKFIDIADEIIIPATKETKEFILNSEIINEKIKFVQNGTTRQGSVYNGIMSCDNADIILIHDGARPYISKETILETIEMTRKHKAVVVGKMATDTIKVVENGKVVKTLDRNTIFQAQTPQAFEYNLIKNIHIKYKDMQNFTDDCSMAEASGINPYVVISKGKNDKITVREDIKQFC